MHSRIFKLTNDPEADTITESDIYDLQKWFVNSIADYVCETDEECVLEDVMWLINTLDVNAKEYMYITNKNENHILITFKKGFKREYFRNKFNKFKNTVDSMTLEDFSGLTDFDMYYISLHIKENRGFYVLTEYDELITFDEFVRSIDDENVTFYLNGTLDYHS